MHLYIELLVSLTVSVSLLLQVKYLQPLLFIGFCIDNCILDRYALCICICIFICAQIISCMDLNIYTYSEYSNSLLYSYL